MVSERIGLWEDLLKFDLRGTIVTFAAAFEDRLSRSVSLLIHC